LYDRIRRGISKPNQVVWGFEIAQRCNYKWWTPSTSNKI